MESNIVLIRHGITEGNVRRLYYGATNVPLAQKGIDELKRLTAEGIYPDPEAAQFFTTGMGRTQQTLELIYGDRPHEIIKDLREINFGMFEMKTYEELMAYEEYRDWITATNDTKAPPEGESIRDFNRRVIRGFETVREKHDQWLQGLQEAPEDEAPADKAPADGTPEDEAPADGAPKEPSAATGDPEATNDPVSDAVPGSIIICHGGTISAVMNYIWPGVHDNMYGWLPDPGHGFRLLLEDDEIRGYEEF